MLEDSKKSNKKEPICDEDMCRFMAGCCCCEDDKVRELEMVQEYPIPSPDIETRRAMKEREKLRRHNDTSRQRKRGVECPTSHVEHVASSDTAWSTSGATTTEKTGIHLHEQQESSASEKR